MSKLKDKLPKEGGFTIIEVVLVLAIAGLIFLIVFLALPQLQKSRRDTQRKSDAGRFVAALENYAGNTNGAYPQIADIVPLWIEDNVDENFNDPTTGVQYVRVLDTAVAAGDPGQFSYNRNGQCRTDGSPGIEPGDGPRDVAVLFKLEQGLFCQDNK